MARWRRSWACWRNASPRPGALTCLGPWVLVFAITLLPSMGGEPPETTSRVIRPVEEPNRVLLGPGVELRGKGGELPVTVRWVHSPATPEAIAVDDGIVYVADEFIYAFDLMTGEQVWRAEGPKPPDGLWADGGVRIGLLGQDSLRVWAPFNYDITIDRRTGETLHFTWRTLGSLPEMQRIPHPHSTRYRLGWRPDGLVGVARSGGVAWSIHDAERWLEPLGPIEVPGGLVMTTQSGLLVVLDYD